MSPTGAVADTGQKPLPTSRPKQEHRCVGGPRCGRWRCTCWTANIFPSSAAPRCSPTCSARRCYGLALSGPARGGQQGGPVHHRAKGPDRQGVANRGNSPLSIAEIPQVSPGVGGGLVWSVGQFVTVTSWSSSSVTATGSSQWGQGPPSPILRMKVPHSLQRCCPTARVAQLSHS